MLKTFLSGPLPILRPRLSPTLRILVSNSSIRQARSYQSSRPIYSPGASVVTRERSLSLPGSEDWTPAQQSGDRINNIDKFIQVLAPAFLGDPLYTWFLKDFPMSEHKALLRKLFSALLRQASLNNGVFLEAGGFGSCGLLMPPGSRLENPWTMLQAGLVPALWALGPGTFKVRLWLVSWLVFHGSGDSHATAQRLIIDFAGDVESIFKKGLTKEEHANHWYGAFMGTAIDRRGQGLGTSIFSHMQQRARSDGRPLCFEAGTTRNRDLYLRHGSKIVGEFVVGKGQVGPDGMPKRHGEGITIWPMVWRPE
ncbi:hypothetical protein F4802DRAFT_320853 [Xylaria palmicola]|nr:hypothetical protein F4802DRAFT_320853 [Xylaria palmicola]